MTTALDDVSLSIDEGERVAIIGPSGSGKSTLLSILGLLDRPSSGEYILDGAKTSQLSDKQRTNARKASLSFVFQAFHLIPYLNVMENVEEGQRIGGVRSTRERRMEARLSLERLGMESRLEAFPPSLSGGEQQRVAIARALARAPKLLLCDEPTGNLDSANSERVLDALVGSNRGREAVVIVTHDSKVAERCDRIISVSDGKAIST